MYIQTQRISSVDLGEEMEQQNTSATGQYPMSIVNFAPLNGVNYKKWKEDIELNLGILDFDHVLKEDPPEDATNEIKFKHQQWHKHNRMALIYMKKCMIDAVKGGIPDSDLAKTYFTSSGEKYKVSDKAETGFLMNKLIRMNFNGQGSIRGYILQGIDTSSKLKEMKVEIDDSFLVHLLLNSLPDQYSHLRSLYNTQKEKWNLDELISICVQEESDINKKGKAVMINYMAKSKNKKFSGKFHKGNTPNHSGKSDCSKGKFPKNPKEVKCFFCKKVGHFKKDCEGFKDWLNKKGIIKNNNTKST